MATLIKSIPFKASDLKKELVQCGIKVLMCKSNNERGAVLAIESSLENQKSFIDFCIENNYAGVCAKMFRENIITDQNYIDYGNVFKYS